MTRFGSTLPPMTLLQFSENKIVHVDVRGDRLLNRNARQMTFALQNATEITKRSAIFTESYA